jgi:hypothetical protein
MTQLSSDASALFMCLGGPPATRARSPHANRLARRPLCPRAVASMPMGASRSAVGSHHLPAFSTRRRPVLHKMSELFLREVRD